MVSFWVYDVAFLILFSLGVFLFLKNRREELSKEGWLFMWRTQFGINAIGKFTKKFGFIMKRMRWLIVGVGGVLMACMLWMFGKTIAIYLLYPEITKLIKAPPIAPLIPYFPKLFGMESLFPPFYFTYFIVALAIVAIAHEFSHGIFMRLFKIKIKSTGLVFLGPILGAFVEQSEKSMKSKGKLNQMTVLAAGVFANLLMALLFYGIYVGFFFSSFAASGYVFNSYAGQNVLIADIDSIGEDVGELYVLVNGQSAMLNMTEVTINGNDYFMSTDVKNTFARGIDIENAATAVFLKAPAILAGMKGAIIKADDVEVSKFDDLRWFLESKKSGDVVRFTTEYNGDVEEYAIMLAAHPNDSDRAYLGIGHNEPNNNGIVQKFLSKFMSFKESSTYYKPTWDGNFVYFLHHLFWWIMIINLLVALFNMLPLGMLDGGRFLYLAVWGVSGSEKWGKRVFKFATYLLLFLFALIMFFWFVRII